MGFVERARAEPDPLVVNALGTPVDDAGSPPTGAGHASRSSPEQAECLPGGAVGQPKRLVLEVVDEPIERSFGARAFATEQTS